MSTAAPTLTRTVFETSRLMEFFSDKELTMQIGFPPDQWPLALLKELLDNGLDSCETAGILPELTVTLAEDSLCVQDNGPGLPLAVLKRSLDYLVRVSDKSHYVSPTRGQLGNALKCVWAASYVVDGTRGCVTVETGGRTYTIRVTLAPFAQQPTIDNTTARGGVVKSGTRITVHWPQIASSLARAADAGFYNVDDLLRRYGLFNPHATFRCVDVSGAETVYARTNATWPHWLPSQPTSPHWYTLDRFQALLSAYIATDQQRGRLRTVRELVEEFAGLKGTAKQHAVARDANLAGADLGTLVTDGALDAGRVQRLLTAMQAQSREVKPANLGVLGAAHLRTWLTAYLGIAPESFQYKKCEGDATHVPYVLEVAFGWCVKPDPDRMRVQLLGVNWTPALREPFPTLPSLLGTALVDVQDPVVVVVHLACPRLQVMDRGKTTVALPWDIRVAVQQAVPIVTKAWTKLRKQADHQDRVRTRDMETWIKQQQRVVVSVKEAAYTVMEEAYLKASGQGQLPATARQIMYAARPLIIARTGKRTALQDSAYFTQKLLPDFMAQYPDRTAGWDVVFDARGHFKEPHTGREFGLGTLEVRRYLRQWQDATPETVDDLTLKHAIPTHGPTGRYQYALFIEKEGFREILDRAQIEARYDLALMSTKGMTVTAARQLAEALTRAGVMILVLHDFDKSGFEILDKFTTDTRRYQYTTVPNVIDLGLRLWDVEAIDLDREPAPYPGTTDPRISLRTCGATEEECEVLVQGRHGGTWEGERVELNAMTSDQFIAWLEVKLQAAGVDKYVPDAAMLASAYRRQWQQMVVQRAIDAAMDALPTLGDIPIPATLEDAVRDALLVDSAVPWDGALWDIVTDAFDAQHTQDRLGRQRLTRRPSTR